MQRKQLANRDRKRVLVVEDDAWIRWFVCDVLVDDGYEVMDAADAKASWEVDAEAGSCVEPRQAKTRAARHRMLPRKNGAPGRVMGDCGLMSSANDPFATGGPMIAAAVITLVIAPWSRPCSF